MYGLLYSVVRITIKWEQEVSVFWYRMKQENMLSAFQMSGTGNQGAKEHVFEEKQSFLVSEKGY